MKDRLTPTQSQFLIELGVDPSKASENMLIIHDTDGCNLHCSEYKEPIFTLTDILSLLPKEIIIEGYPYHLNIDYPYLIDGVAARYLDEEEDSLTGVLCFELIDALFELLCWVLKNHPDKIKRL